MTLVMQSRHFQIRFDPRWGRPASLRQPDDPLHTEWLATPRNLCLMTTDRSIGFGVLQWTVAGHDGWSAPVRWPGPGFENPDIRTTKNGVSVRGSVRVGKRGIDLQLEWRLRAGRLHATWEIHNPGRACLRLGELGWQFPMNTNYGRFPRTRQNLERMYRRQVIEHPFAGGYSGWALVERVGRDGDCLLIAAEEQTPFNYYDHACIQYEDRIPFTDRPPYLPPANDKKARAAFKSVGNHFPWPGVLRMFAAADSLLKRHNQTKWLQPAPPISIPAGETVRFGWSLAWLPDRSRIVDHQGRTGQVGIRLLPSPVIPRDDETHLAVACKDRIQPVPGPGVTVKRRSSPGDKQCFTVAVKRHGPLHLDLRRPDGRCTRISLFGTHPLPEAMRRRARCVDREQYYRKPRSMLNGALLIRHNPSGELVAKLRDLWGCGCYEGGICEARFLAEKNVLQPDRSEIERLREYANGFLRKLHNRKTGEVYWLLPPAWPHRSFNYTHVANFYYAMYRIHRRHPTFGEATEWLALAMDTFAGMFQHSRPALLPIGQIGGEVTMSMIAECEQIGLGREYAEVIRRLRRRQKRIASVDPPRPANNGYDNVCLGEYAQARRLLGDKREARVVTDIMVSARGPQPTWFQYASEKRWWDGIGHAPYRHWTDLGETCLHYSVGANTQALLEAYEAGGDAQLLELGAGGLRSQWALVDAGGHAAMCFTPSPLSHNYGFNQYSGDAGTGLSGAVYNAACYVTRDPDFGWIALGGRLTARGDKLRVEPRDAARRKIVVRELGLIVESPDRPIGHAIVDIRSRTAEVYDE